MAAVAQNDVHPLLRHPMPIKRDFAKAQRMLRLIADDEERLKGLQREKSVTTRWLERPLYEHLEASDMELEREEKVHRLKADSVHDEKEKDDDADLLERWTKPDRPMSSNSEASIFIEPKTKLDTSFVKRRPDPINCPRPISYNAQHVLRPACAASPATMSPNMQRPRPFSLQPNSPSTGKRTCSSNGSVEPVPFQSQSLASLESPTANEPRPRPTSFVTYSHQRNRSNSKIASSRGLRNNSYPNFPLPISGVAPKAVPGEHMENDMVYQRFGDDEVGPPSPSSPIRNALDGFEQEDDQSKTEKKKRHRWSSIPQTLKKFARRRSSAAAQETPKFDVRIEDLRRMNLTEQNLHWYENEVRQAPSTPKTRFSGLDVLPTPTYSPVDMENPVFESALPLPFAPWADGGPPSPSLSMDKRRGSGTSSVSLSRKTAPSQLSVEGVPQMRPTSLHSQRSSVVSIAPQRHSTIDAPLGPHPSTPRTPTSRRGTPTLERTCIICKTTKPPAEFIDRRITANCWHEPATCLGCLQSRTYASFNTQGLDQCTCPECGEGMTYAEVGALFDDETFLT